MKISFLVTYYNQAKYVKSSLESIFAQKIPCDFEVLVGDDGSGDNTVAEVKKFQKEHPNIITIYQMPRDNTVKYNPIYRAAANRLNLVKHATGDYLMFLDGDDNYCDNTFIKKALDDFKHNKDIVASAFNFKYTYSSGKEIVNKSVPSNGLVKKAQYLRCCYLPAGAMVLKNVFTDADINRLQSTKSFDDNVITVFMLQYGDMYYNDLVIYSYRQTDSSIWNSMSETEQTIVNAMDYEMLCKIAPKLKNSIYRRNFSSVKRLYKKRKILSNIVSAEILQKYILQNKELGNSLIEKILKYTDLSLWQRVLLRLKMLVIKYTHGML